MACISSMRTTTHERKLPRVWTEAPTDLVLLGGHNFFDVFEGPEQEDGNMVVEFLEQALALECQEFVFPRS